MVAATVTDAKARRLAELREFLMSRRARVSPAEAGLPDGGGRRRTPGLRREEVAVLAGVGASWYQWLEQGRDISVSPQVLDSVARVLKLSGTERRHLYVLAGLNPPPPEVAREDRDMCEGLRRLIDAWLPYPAHIMDAYWNCVMYNDAAAAVLGMRSETAENCLLSFFTDPIYRSRSRSWEQNAPQVVAMYRAACSERPDDDGFASVVAAVKAASPDFAELWERRDIRPGGQVTKEIEHPVAGPLFLESTQLRVPARPDLVIVLHTPTPHAEADTAAQLAWLASPEGRRGAMHPVAG
ncbi:XRE family transcriptional regulator [Streptomyces alfalfae]|uniref:Helix-turn-helix domain-containing protein n=1 Tax=Streptomyces alfalfae TaxID=1642299 RepID=A0A1P8TL69_9ACTN|nr:helix-turn-helix transcriptional regulator [Streptomyces alfalfae]AYA18811.1 XRE family transcriptional regulator [Streptomyces fradiae]APY88407.1 transcriptional regulator [Streptomyces alfalfae]QQC89217.1 helix-turn-helix domain-containing protein [Streptomyces alfalfae]QUI31667.1 helix-turn-helix domain-containing protein [Streptomyces alfalfae]RXX46026.1 XRE family transcriptional regulator [Streptomyces alfalfae]